MGKVIEFRDFKIFKNNEQKYVYSIKDNKICEVDERVIRLLDQSGKGYQEIQDVMIDVFTEVEFGEIMSQLDEYGFIEKEEGEELLDNRTSEISSIILLVAQDCNLRCSYCYADGGDYKNTGIMNVETAKKSIDFLVKKTKNKQIAICFFGGEPLMNFEIIQAVVDYCHLIEQQSDVVFGFTMTTNGTMISEKIQDFIIKNRIRVQISIDGDKDIHDENRYYSKNVGSHDIVLEKTKKLRENRLIDARATITPKELNITYIYDYLNSLGFDQITLSPAFNLFDYNEYELIADAYIDFYKEFEMRIKDKKYDEVKNNRMFIKELRDIHKSGVRKVACGAGGNLYAIDINGEIYPCQRFVGTLEQSLGNVFEGDDKKERFIKSIEIGAHLKCQECWARNLCLGGCFHDNYESTGTVNLSSHQFCEFKKKVAEEVIYIYLRLSDEEIREVLGD